jgi:hypothetical protein
MAGAALVGAGPPRAARAERVPTRVLLRPDDDDSAWHGPLHRSCQAHHLGGECPISGGRAGYCQGETDPAVSSVSRT